MSTIEVHVRMLPTKGESAWWTGPTHISPKSKPDLTFPFSHVHNSCCTNSDIFQALVSLVSQVHQNSSNVTIMAYGQTGSGKTYTMVGEPGKHSGIFHLAADVLIKEVSFRASAISKEFKDYLSTAKLHPPSIIPSVSKRKVEFVDSPDIRTEAAFGLRCAYLEIYNEQIRDLLQNPPVDVDIREGFNRDAIYLDKLSWHSFANIETLQELLVKGEKSRATTPTPLNIHSSRSHTILTIERVKLILERSISKSEVTALRIERVPGQLHLVDLAGSECARLAATSGAHLREGGFINKSLLSLGNVVDAIVDNRAHIPYRESKLTRILSNSLGLSKNSRTAIICCINPDPANIEQSLAGLRFAQRASKVVVHPKVLGTQPPSCILQLLNLAKQSRVHGMKQIGQLYAAGLHDSTYISMHESRRYINLITHMFIDECNHILSEYRQAVETVGCVLSTKRGTVRSEIEEIQRQASYLKALSSQNCVEKENLHAHVLDREREIVEMKEIEERERICFDSYDALYSLRFTNLNFIGQECLEIIRSCDTSKNNIEAKLKDITNFMRSEQNESENLQREHFIKANTQRLARRKCDFVNIETADIEHQIRLLEESLSRGKSKLQARLTHSNHLLSLQKRLEEVESMILEKQVKLNEIQHQAYGFASVDYSEKPLLPDCKSFITSESYTNAIESNDLISTVNSQAKNISDYMLNKDLRKEIQLEKIIGPGDGTSNFANHIQDSKPLSAVPYISDTKATVHEVRHTL